ncbi:hypothetical protein GmHk_18G050475 [Glycine max]|nr:hypothetical protein GmHk_18G050475 [Glycine max]
MKCPCMHPLPFIAAKTEPSFTLCMSVEAFAMAGVDCMENTINNVCALEQSLSPEAEKRHCNITTSSSLDDGMAIEWVKMKMREWASAVASNNDTKANLTVSEILLIMDNHFMRPKPDT